MWILAPDFFLSIVDKDPTGRGRLCVRARVRQDLVRFKPYCPGLSRITRDDLSDYEYRAYADPADVGVAMARVTASIDYSNFKAEVTHRQGKKRHDLYLRVWSTLLTGLESPRRKRLWRERLWDSWPDEDDFDLSA